MLDSFGRRINYLRISITDRCNLHCVYCKGVAAHFPKADILSYEEILRLCNILAQLGVEHFRITGGEALVRKDCATLVHGLKQFAKTVTLTTNGTVDYITELKHAGLDGINISLDSTDAAEYASITGADNHSMAMATIKKAVEAGLTTKINAVLLEGINHQQVLPLAKLAEKMPISVRFIELMPTGANGSLSGVQTENVLAQLQAKYHDLAPFIAPNSAGPAVYYSSKLMLGNVGLISASASNFCQNCNRIRLSSTGFLQLCLHSNHGIDLRHLLRNGSNDDGIVSAILRSVAEKPKQHQLHKNVSVQDMSKIGG